jgi:AcrR family transcriptional regulator
MTKPNKRATRTYNAPARTAAALRTRQRVLASARKVFEARGWAGATIPLIALRAGVSHQTIEATFGTKAGLLEATVDFVIRGDADTVPLAGREAVAAMEATPDAATMLDMHARQVRAVSERSAQIAWAVEHAAPTDPRIALLWKQMTRNRTVGVRWAAETLLSKRDVDMRLERADIEDTFWLALDWGTYRTLTRERGLRPDDFEVWLRRYYEHMLGS